MLSNTVNVLWNNDKYNKSLSNVIKVKHNKHNGNIIKHWKITVKYNTYIVKM